MSWFNGLSITWKIIIIVAIIVVVYLVYKKTRTKFVELTQPKEIVLLPGESKNISAQKREDIKTIASGIFNDIEDTSITGHSYDSYDQALLLTDNELAFMADYYKTYLSIGKSLYAEIDTQYYITSGIPQKLMARLAAIGKR